jgi:4'-phosphopantetheinyl transferase
MATGAAASRLPAQLSGDVLLACALDPRRVGDAALARVRSLLSDDEVERLAGTRLARVRREFLVSRGLVRRVLGRLLAVPPATLSFVRGEHGKPALGGLAAGRLRFNLSHTHGLVVLAVTRDVELGIDVEWPRRRGRLLDIAARFFHPDELAALCALPPGRRRGRFFALWTLKEAYLKARGLGVPAPLRQYCFSFRGRRPLAVFGAALGEDPASWQMLQRRLPSGHLVAVAAATGRGRRLRLRWLTLASLDEVPPPAAQLVKSG